MWTEPVFDRTRQDIETARAYLAGKMSHGPLIMADGEFRGADVPFWVRLTSADALKGFINALDLVRIEGNSRYLADLLILSGYGTEIETRTSWDMYDFPWQTELERIRENIEKMVRRYAVCTDTPEVPDSLARPHYEDINAIERILFDIYRLYHLMTYRYCGDMECGEG